MNESLAGGSERDELCTLRPRREWSADKIKRIGYCAADMIAQHLTTLPEKPVFRPFPPDLAAKYLDSKAPSQVRRLSTFWPPLLRRSKRTLSETAIRGFTGG